jgi:hypothetical protein
MAAVSARGPVRLHIDRLVVDGVPAQSGRRFADETLAELRRLAAAGAPPVPDHGSELGVDPEQDPVGAARAVAAVIHSRLVEARHG